VLDLETKKRIADFFDGWELVEFLQLKIDEVVDAFEDEIEENIDDIEEFMGVREKYDETD
jgi:hypothetical protein